MGFGWRFPDKAIQAETQSREPHPHELNISRAPVFLRSLFLREKQVRENDSGQSMGNARYENVQDPEYFAQFICAQNQNQFPRASFPCNNFGKFYYTKVTGGLITLE